MAFFDVSSTYQKRKAALAVFGIMIMLSTAFLGTWLTAVLISPTLALQGGLSFVVFVGGCLGFLVVLANQTAQQVSIRVIEDSK